MFWVLNVLVGWVGEWVGVLLYFQSFWANFVQHLQQIERPWMFRLSGWLNFVAGRAQTLA